MCVCQRMESVRAYSFSLSGRKANGPSQHDEPDDNAAHIPQYRKRHNAPRPSRRVSYWQDYCALAGERISFGGAADMQPLAQFAIDTYAQKMMRKSCGQ